MTDPLGWKVGPKKIVSAYVTNDPAQAELAKNALIAEGIQCEVEPQSCMGLGPPRRPSGAGPSRGSLPCAVGNRKSRESSQAHVTGSAVGERD